MKYDRFNFGYGTIKTALTDIATTMIMNAGHNFPVDAAKYFKLIVWDDVAYPDPADDPNLEIVTAHYSGTLNEYTITRGEESTLATTHAIGSACAATNTAGLSSSDLSVVGTKEVDETNIADGAALTYDSGSGKIVYKSAISLWYTTPGNYTWVCPAGVTKILLTMLGGGGGGGGTSESGHDSAGAGGGGAGGLYMMPYTVVPGNTYSITVGAGGVGGVGHDTGDTGGSTTFGTVTVTGGAGGTPNGAAIPGEGGLGGGIAPLNGGKGSDAGVGAGGAGASTPYGGVGGLAGASYDDGGDASGFGAGGGGGGHTGSYQNGGDGSGGFVHIRY